MSLTASLNQVHQLLSLNDNVQLSHNRKQQDKGNKNCSRLDSGKQQTTLQHKTS